MFPSRVIKSIPIEQLCVLMSDIEKFIPIITVYCEMTPV